MNPLKAPFVRECVLTIMSDDYENFSKLMEDTRRICKVRGLRITLTDVVDGIRVLIEQGDAKAYRLSPFEPSAKEVEFSPELLKDLWYYATPQGREKVKGIPHLMAEDVE